jgi:hypothetical protein
VSPHILTLLVNLGLALAAAVIFVSWIRSRREDYRDITRAEISEDLAAQDELLEDVIDESSRREELAKGR